MLFKCLFGIAIAIGIGIEHTGMIVLFDYVTDRRSLSGRWHLNCFGYSSNSKATTVSNIGWDRMVSAGRMKVKRRCPMPGENTKYH
jgi:hypothetical protein